jgi:hypothetical protein
METQRGLGLHIVVHTTQFIALDGWKNHGSEQSFMTSCLTLSCSEICPILWTMKFRRPVPSISSLSPIPS